MINNTSLQKWNRLAQKQLDQQFLNEIITGLQCSPFEANAILDTVYKVYAPYFETSGTLKPGQILFSPARHNQYDLLIRKILCRPAKLRNVFALQEAFILPHDYLARWHLNPKVDQPAFHALEFVLEV